MKQLLIYIPIAIALGMICANMIFNTKRPLIDSLEIASIVAILLVIFVGSFFITYAVIYDLKK